MESQKTGSAPEPESTGTRLIIAVPDNAEAIQTEYQRFLERASVEGWSELRIRFGYAWGIGTDTNCGAGENVSPETLAEKVAAAESRNEGRLGGDDLYVTPVGTGVEHLFCHEADIHLTGPENSGYLESEARRYASLGWTVYESRKSAAETAFRKVSLFVPKDGDG